MNNGDIAMIAITAVIHHTKSPDITEKMNLLHFGLK